MPFALGIDLLQVRGVGGTQTGIRTLAGHMRAPCYRGRQVCDRAQVQHGRLRFPDRRVWLRSASCWPCREDTRGALPPLQIANPSMVAPLANPVRTVVALPAIPLVVTMPLSTVLVVALPLSLISIVAGPLVPARVSVDLPLSPIAIVAGPLVLGRVGVAWPMLVAIVGLRERD